MNSGSVQQNPDNYIYCISDVSFSTLNEIFIQSHSNESFNPDERGFLDLYTESIEIDSAVFSNLNRASESLLTCVIMQEKTLLFSCPCHSVTDKLCSHQAQAFYNICKRKELRIFFDEQLRYAELRKFAEPYGLQNERSLEEYFKVEHREKSFEIVPLSASILPVSIHETIKLTSVIKSPAASLSLNKLSHKQEFILFKLHKYYKHLTIELLESESTRSGKLKNPIYPLNVAEKILQSDDADVSKFYFSIHQFHTSRSEERSETSINALKAIIRNPLDLPFYLHSSEVSENVVSSSVKPLQIGRTIQNIELNIVKKDLFYEISAVIDLVDTKPALDLAKTRLDYFLEIEGIYHLIGKFTLLNLIEYFKRHNNILLIHKSKYSEFQENFLAKLENETAIHYEYLPPATQQQITEHKMDQPAQKIIYLKGSDPYVELDPVMKYGDLEVSILSQKQLYPPGVNRTFILNRDRESEINFSSLIIKQHPHFREQAEDALPCFYLHKKHFLDEDWFLRTFEEWRNHGISILGFNKLKQNMLNPHPAKITVRVLSGLDWFNADIDVSFGRKKASLKQINKAVRNKNKYVTLDDGTLGILPEEWLNKFSEYFSNGDLEDHSLKIHKSNFSVITDLFEEEMIDSKVKDELRFFNQKLADFNSIEDVDIPTGLTANLRHYQKLGLNWLNFLDDFNFGGCLADDMGLGKTLQIIAFVLLLRKKIEQNTNLLVVPTSLIFNWQAEIEKFAPDLKVHILYGPDRASNYKAFSQYELIITSYGTLLSDVRFLKNFEFNYVFLDESQNIKNPDSQRYKAACLLKSRNRIVITGTPIENNTFDLFGQLSFACPGLLGNKQYFKDIFLNPIDQFEDSRRAKELQRKIQPFILRRTKAQVVKELPEKTEVVLYCEMGPQQQKIYDAFEKEFREFVCSKTQEEIPRASVHVLKGLTRLRQICDSPLLLNDDEIPERQSAKIDVLMEQVLNKISEHKILIFSQFVSMLDLIRKELEERDISFSYLTGSTKNRNEVVDEFQNDPVRRIFLISLKAGGTGLNLTEADYVYLVDPWWNPAVENQAIDRVYRIGQKKNVVAVRLICTGTVEEKMMQMQAGKKDLFNDLITVDTAIGKSFTKDGLLKLLNTPLA